VRERHAWAQEGGPIDPDDIGGVQRKKGPINPDEVGGVQMKSDPSNSERFGDVQRNPDTESGSNPPPPSENQKEILKKLDELLEK
jgi:hypothetical protein